MKIYIFENRICSYEDWFKVAVLAETEEDARDIASDYAKKNDNCDTLTNTLYDFRSIDHWKLKEVRDLIPGVILNNTFG